jgi:hypothetical protein
MFNPEVICMIFMLPQLPNSGEIQYPHRIRQTNRQNLSYQMRGMRAVGYIDRHDPQIAKNRPSRQTFAEHPILPLFPEAPGFPADAGLRLTHGHSH